MVPSLLPLLTMGASLHACNGPDDAEKDRPAVAETPGCDANIAVPAPLGELSEDPPDPHELAFGSAPEPFQVHLGWPGSDPSTSAGFLWRTDTDTLATVVEYGVGTELTERATGASFRFGGTLDAPGTQRIHEVKLCSGLEPATTYSYRVGGDDHWSPVYTFTTPGAPDSFDTFRVAIVGDSRGAYEIWNAVMLAIDAEDPDLILFTGDMVEFGTLQAEWDAWFEATGDILARRPLLAAHGNHEFMAAQYFSQWMFPGNEQWFDVRYGPLHLAVLNDTVPDSSQIQGVETDFLREIWSGSDAPWKAAMHHQGVYSTCSRHGSNEDVRDAWTPLFDEYGAQLVFAGHNHVYERSVPIRGGQEVAPGEGTVYLVAGGGGADLYNEFAEQWFGAVGIATEHYLIGDFGPTEATFVVRDLVGNEIDRFAVPIGAR